MIKNLGSRAQTCRMRGDQVCIGDRQRGRVSTQVQVEGSWGGGGGLPLSPQPSCPPSQGSRGELLLSLCYNPSANSIIVNIIKARNLKAMDIGGTSGAGASRGRGHTGQGGSGAREPRCMWTSGSWLWPSPLSPVPHLQSQLLYPRALALSLEHPRGQHHPGFCPSQNQEESAHDGGETWVLVPAPTLLARDLG